MGDMCIIKQLYLWLLYLRIILLIVCLPLSGPPMGSAKLEQVFPLRMRHFHLLYLILSELVPGAKLSMSVTLLFIRLLFI